MVDIFSAIHFHSLCSLSIDKKRANQNERVTKYKQNIYIYISSAQISHGNYFVVHSTLYTVSNLAGFFCCFNLLFFVSIFFSPFFVRFVWFFLLHSFFGLLLLFSEISRHDVNAPMHAISSTAENLLDPSFLITAHRSLFAHSAVAAFFHTFSFGCTRAPPKTHIQMALNSIALAIPFDFHFRSFDGQNRMQTNAWYTEPKRNWLYTRSNNSAMQRVFFQSPFLFSVFLLLSIAVFQFLMPCKRHSFGCAIPQLTNKLTQRL